MAILQTDWKLVVYKLKHTENGIDYEGDKVTYDAGEIDGVNPAYMFLSVCSKTGDVALSFAELEKTSGTFTKRKPETEYKHCRIFRNEKGNCDTIEFQGRAVYANNKLVLVGEHTLQVHHIDSLKMEYFLDLHDLKKGYEAFIGGEDIARQVTWAKKNKSIQSSVDEGIKLISITRHIHSNILVTTYRGDITRVWSILDGSLLVSFKQGKSEHFMAISENQRFIATYEEENKCVNVYCSKSGLRLYRYHPKGVNVNAPDSYVTSVRFCTHRNYITISGITKYMEESTKYKSFYEVWSISQEQLVFSVEEGNVFKNAVYPFILERQLDNVQGQNDSRSNTPSPPPQDTENNVGSSENGISGRNTPKPPSVDPKPETCHCVLYGIFMKKSSNQLEFRSTLVYDCTKNIGKKAQAPEVTYWKDFLFQKLDGGTPQRGFLHVVCDPLGGKNTISYVLNHESGIYLLRFGVGMTQLWKLRNTSDEEQPEAAKNDGNIFDFGNLPSPSEATYYNTLSNSDLIFARAYKGNHHGISSTFRDTWGSLGPTFRFMDTPGHVIVKVRKETDGSKKPRLRKDPSWIRKLGNKIGRTFHLSGSDKKRESQLIDDELFLPLFKINSHSKDYEFCEIESAFQALHHIDSLKFTPTSPVSTILNLPYICIHSLIFVFLFFFF
jgi:hypothetical protein